MITHGFLLYKNFKYQNVLDLFEQMIEYSDAKSEMEKDFASDIAGEFVSKLVEIGSSHGYEGNLWQDFLTYLLANNENPYSKACEIRGNIEGSLNDIAFNDFKIFKKLFNYDVKELLKSCSLECDYIFDYNCGESFGVTFNKRVRDRIMELSVTLAKAETTKEFKQHVTSFYKEFGVGKFGLHKAFRLEETDKLSITPITNIAKVDLDDLIGYESAKKKLIENTESFINKLPCNNCLLFGEAGTGKSSSIKGILNKYYDQGLRIIEVYRHQFKYLNEIIAQIKNRNYRFIIYMDDLSFEDHEIEYKYLKAVIEGGLEKKPENVLIYATSNRRHLVKESFSDKNDYDDELHKSDTVQEKISLSSRFGVSIYFPSPNKREFNNIVLNLAKKYDIDMEEEKLLLEANKWQVLHGNMSGRCAMQFVDYMRGFKACE